MNVEEKQALIMWLKEGVELREEYGFSGNLLASMHVALSALTAQPVNLSSCRTLWYDHDDLSAEVKCIPVKDIKKAIRAAGYEVIE